MHGVLVRETNKSSTQNSSNSDSSLTSSQQVTPDTILHGAYSLVRTNESVPPVYLPTSDNTPSNLLICRAMSVMKEVRSYHLIPTSISPSTSARDLPLLAGNAARSKIEHQYVPFTAHSTETKDLNYVMKLVNTIFQKYHGIQVNNSAVHHDDSGHFTSSNSDDNSLYTKELKLKDMKTLIPCLQAGSLRVDSHTEKWIGQIPGAIPNTSGETFHRMYSVLDDEMSFNSQIENEILSPKLSHSSLANQVAVVDVNEKYIGVGLMWETKQTHDFSTSQRLVSVGVKGLIAVYSKSPRYTHVLSAMGLRDELRRHIGISLPIVV